MGDQSVVLFASAAALIFGLLLWIYAFVLCMRQKASTNEYLKQMADYQEERAKKDNFGKP